MEILPAVVTAWKRLPSGIFAAGVLLVAACATPAPTLQPRALGLASGYADALAYSPDGQVLIALREARNNSVVVLSASTGEVLRTLKGKERPFAGPVFGTIAFATDGHLVAIAGLDDMLTVWDAHDWHEVRRFPETRGVTGAVMLSDGRRVAAAGPDEIVRLWDIESGRETGRLVGHRGAILTIDLSRDGRTIATGGIDRTIRLWDVDTAREVAVLEGHVAPVMSVKFAPDGRGLASTAAGFDILLWRLEGGAPVATPLLDPAAETAAQAHNLRLRQWVNILPGMDLDDAKRVPPEAIPSGSGPVPIYNCPLAYSPDGTLLAIIHHGGDLRGGYGAEVYDTVAHRRLARYPIALGALAFSPDNRTLAISGLFHLARLDPLTGGEKAR